MFLKFIYTANEVVNEKKTRWLRNFDKSIIQYVMCVTTEVCESVNELRPLFKVLRVKNGARVKKKVGAWFKLWESVKRRRSPFF